MYLFQHLLPVLPREDRLQLCFAVLELYHNLPPVLSLPVDAEALQISHLHLTIQAYEMFRLETLGKTNTRCNPFEVV